MTLTLAAIAACLAASALFAGAETGFYSVHRLRLRLRLRANRPHAAVLQMLLDRMDRTIMTALVGTNLMLYAATALATGLWSAFRYAEIWATLSMTPVIFVFSEMIPKELFRRKADSLMYDLAGVFDGFCLLFRPFTTPLRGLVALLTRRLPPERKAAVFASTSPSYLTTRTRREDVLAVYRAALSANVIQLLQRKVSSVATPLDQVEMIESGVRGDALRAAAAQIGSAHVPVFRGERTNVVGILRAADAASTEGDGLSAGDLAARAPTVRPDDASTAVLVVLRREHQPAAVVTDDAGRAAAIVTADGLVDDVVAGLPGF